MAELNVSRKNIRKLFSEMQDRKFIIPDYQRPYKWDKEKCETLWNDISNFFTEKKSDEEEYFLGTIVTCKGEDQKAEIEIIDGQQRITSLFLLLRAFYKKLENAQKETDNIRGLKSQIEPCIWNVDPISRKVKDVTKIHIESRVVTENDNEIFLNILEKGIIENNKCLYTSNYKFFLDKCEEYAKDNPANWEALCVTILEKCIVLPIECDNVEIALTIFTTLNDRGMPLSDSDIFKAQIYKTKKSENEKKDFTEDWKELTEKIENAGITLDDIFRYYTHIIRAKNNDKSKEIGLRKFFAENKYEKLKENNLIVELSELSDFWLAINRRETKINNDEKISDEAKKYLHCLQQYPNEYWKYITCVFFYKNKDSEDFINTFPQFLKKLTAFLFAKFIEKPTVNAIKDDIFQNGIEVFKNNTLKVEIDINDTFKKLISDASSSKIAKSLILLHAYQNVNQKTIIPDNFEIEHIFPTIWQNTNYNGWSKEDAKEYLEKFGNKVAIEKKINIQAGNKYFGKKKDKYLNSKIADVIYLSSYDKDDWVKDDIERREEKFVTVLLNFFKNNLVS